MDQCPHSRAPPYRPSTVPDIPGTFAPVPGSGHPGHFGWAGSGDGCPATREPPGCPQEAGVATGVAVAGVGEGVGMALARAAGLPMDAVQPSPSFW